MYMRLITLGSLKCKQLSHWYPSLLSWLLKLLLIKRKPVYTFRYQSNSGTVVPSRRKNIKF